MITHISSEIQANNVDTQTLTIRGLQIKGIYVVDTQLPSNIGDTITYYHPVDISSLNLQSNDYVALPVETNNNAFPVQTTSHKILEKTATNFKLCVERNDRENWGVSGALYKYRILIFAF